ncbi:MAG: DUF4258 domain-containing protein [Chloroflexi bacterium]|nr:DUF4258 domain-containing protein [Chloroflexota bacterium]
MDDIRSRFPLAVYREHALLRILERRIHPAIIREAIYSPKAEIIESYEDDPRGASCLVLGWWGEGQPLHIILGLTDPLCVISAYDPSGDMRERWGPDFKTRRGAKQENGK